MHTRPTFVALCIALLLSPFPVFGQGIADGFASAFVITILVGIGAISLLVIVIVAITGRKDYRGSGSFKALVALGFAWFVVLAVGLQNPLGSRGGGTIFERALQYPFAAAAFVCVVIHLLGIWFLGRRSADDLERSHEMQKKPRIASVFAVLNVIFNVVGLFSNLPLFLSVGVQFTEISYETLSLGGGFVINVLGLLSGFLLLFNKRSALTMTMIYACGAFLLQAGLFSWMVAQIGMASAPGASLGLIWLIYPILLFFFVVRSAAVRTFYATT